MTTHNLNPKTSYCYEDCKGCKAEFWTELKILACVFIVGILFFAFFCLCH